MADRLCVELHHYPNGQQEVYIVAPDGTGVALEGDEKGLARLMNALSCLIKLAPGVQPGQNIYITIDENGRVGFEHSTQVA